MNRDQVWGVFRQDLPTQQLPNSYHGAAVHQGSVFPLPVGANHYEPPAPAAPYVPPAAPYAPVAPYAPTAAPAAYVDPAGRGPGYGPYAPPGGPRNPPVPPSRVSVDSYEDLGVGPNREFPEQRNKQSLPPLAHNHKLEADDRMRSMEQLMGVGPDLSARLRAVERLATAAEKVALDAAERTYTQNNELERQVTSLSVALQRSQTEVGSLKQRIDNAEQEASDSRSQITKVREVLEGERLKLGQDFRDREQNQQLWNDAGNTRQQQLSEGVFSLRQEMAVLKSDHEATRNSMSMVIHRLEAQMGAESGFVNKLRDVEAENVSAASQQFMKMSANLVDVQTQIHELTERMASEVANRRAEDQAMMMKLRSAEDTSGQQMGALSSEAHTLVDKRSEELNRRMRLIEDNVNVQTNALREEAEERMRVYGRKDAKDKKTQIERLLVIESTLREVHVTRTQADALTMQAVEASNAKLAAMLLDERQTREAREKKLRDQVQQALLKLRAFARDLEEKLDQGRRQLEDIVRMEIKARFKAVQRLDDTVKEMERTSNLRDGSFRAHIDDTAAKIRAEIQESVVAQVLEAEIHNVSMEDKISQKIDTKVEELEQDLEDSILMLKEQIQTTAAENNKIASDATRVESLFKGEIRKVRGEMAESKKSVLSNMTELEDVIAASIQGVRAGLVTERKELFQALDAQSKETAKGVAQLGMQVQKSLKVVQGTLQEQMESVRQMAEAEAAASVLADELLRVDMQADVEKTADALLSQMQLEKVMMTSLLDEVVGSLEEEMGARKQGDATVEAAARAAFQEVRQEAGRLMGAMADGQEATASELRSEMVGQAQQRADEMDGLVQEMSHLRWQAQGQVQDSSSSMEELRTRVADEMQLLRVDMDVSMADTRLQEELIAAECAEELRLQDIALRSAMQTSVKQAAQDVQGHTASAAAAQEAAMVANMDALRGDLKTAQDAIPTLEAKMMSMEETLTAKFEEVQEQALPELINMVNNVDEVLTEKVRVVTEESIPKLEQALTDQAETLRDELEAGVDDVMEALEAEAAERKEELARSETDARLAEEQLQLVLEETWAAKIHQTRGEVGAMATDLMNALEGETEERQEAVDAVARSTEMQILELREESTAAVTAEVAAREAALRALTEEMQMELRKEALEQTTALETMRVEVTDLRGGLGGDLEGLEASIKDLYSVVEEEVQTRQQDVGEMRDGLREMETATSNNAVDTRLAEEQLRVALESQLSKVEAESRLLDESIKRLEQTTLPDLDAQLEAESRQRGDAIRSVQHQLKEQMDSLMTAAAAEVQAQMLEVKRGNEDQWAKSLKEIHHLTAQFKQLEEGFPELEEKVGTVQNLQSKVEAEVMTRQQEVGVLREQLSSFGANVSNAAVDSRLAEEKLRVVLEDQIHKLDVSVRAMDASVKKMEQETLPDVQSKATTETNARVDAIRKLQEEVGAVKVEAVGWDATIKKLSKKLAARGDAQGDVDRELVLQLEKTLVEVTTRMQEAEARLNLQELSLTNAGQGITADLKRSIGTLEGKVLSSASLQMLSDLRNELLGKLLEEKASFSNLQSQILSRMMGGGGFTNPPPTTTQSEYYQPEHSARTAAQALAQREAQLSERQAAPPEMYAPAAAAYQPPADGMPPVQVDKPLSPIPDGMQEGGLVSQPALPGPQ